MDVHGIVIVLSPQSSQVKRLLPKFHGNKTKKCNRALLRRLLRLFDWFVSTGTRLLAGLSVRSPALDGSTVTPTKDGHDLRRTVS